MRRIFDVFILAFLLGLASCAPEQEQNLADDPKIAVLNYHSIMPQQFYEPLNVDNPWILPQEVFYEHMRYLYENGFNPLTSCQLIDFLHNNADLPKNPVIITFDDGYLDNYLFAAPILRQFGFTAMQFLIGIAILDETPTMTAFPTQFMSIYEILGSKDVFEFGSHTYAMHRRNDGIPLLVSESVEAIRADLRQSFAGPLSFTTDLAYPFGISSANAREALEAEGVKFAFTTQFGYVQRNSSPLMLPRFYVTHHWTIEKFSEIVSGEWRGR
ncbi:MAG: polysaccharide deacetylase family protein [Clostridiales bacterium]|jgi:peptidoglycan/xylan/chitin deacetylase (PgdA/CDA1 family)|nr:polysaccharide deacetylase family protein [Clostridiales bacterium]